MNEQKKIFTIKNMTEKVGIQCIGINFFVSEKGGPLLNIKIGIFRFTIHLQHPR